MVICTGKKKSTETVTANLAGLHYKCLQNNSITQDISDSLSATEHL